MKRDSYSHQQSHKSFQPRSGAEVNEHNYFSQPQQHSSSTAQNAAESRWLNRAGNWVTNKVQAAQNLMTRDGAIATDAILPALRKTEQTGITAQSSEANQPLVGVIDAGFGANEHGTKMVEAIQTANPNAMIWKGEGVGAGGWAESLVEFVDTAKVSGNSRAVANLSFDLTEVHLDGSVSTRSQLTAEEQSALSYAQDNGVLIVASSGNQGGAMSALGQASQPLDNIIVVGAANVSDSFEVGQSTNRAAYSSYGEGLDLVAEVGSAGTSLAAAKVTGTIAQMWNANSGLSDRQVSQILTATPTDLNKLGWDAETGAGLLNAEGAIALARQTIPESIVFSGSQLVQQAPSRDKASSFRSRAWTSTDGAIASERPNWGWSDITHTALDVAGFVPVIGTVADVANGALYLAEGKKTEAALSFAAAVPVVGDAIAVGAKGVKAAKAVEKGVQAARATKTTNRGTEAAQSVGAARTTRSVAKEVRTVRGATKKGSGDVAERVNGATRGSTSKKGGSLGRKEVRRPPSKEAGLRSQKASQESSSRFPKGSPKSTAPKLSGKGRGESRATGLISKSGKQLEKVRSQPTVVKAARLGSHAERAIDVADAVTGSAGSVKDAVQQAAQGNYVQAGLSLTDATLSAMGVRSGRELPHSSVARQGGVSTSSGGDRGSGNSQPLSTNKGNNVSQQPESPVPAHTGGSDRSPRASDQTSSANSAPAPRSASSGNKPPRKPPTGSGSHPLDGDDSSHNNGLPAGNGGDSGNGGSPPIPPSSPNQSSSNGGSDDLESLIETALQKGRKIPDVASDGAVHPSASQIAGTIRSAQRARPRLKNDPSGTSAATEHGPVVPNGYKADPTLGRKLIDNRDDATYRPSGRDNGVPGSASATHAEPKVVQLDIQSNPDSAITALAVDRPVCRSRAKRPNSSSAWCVDHLALTATKEGRTIVVAEPGGVWVFHPDIPANFFKGI